MNAAPRVWIWLRAGNQARSDAVRGETAALTENSPSFPCLALILAIPQPPLNFGPSPTTPQSNVTQPTSDRCMAMGTLAF